MGDQATALTTLSFFFYVFPVLYQGFQGFFMTAVALGWSTTAPVPMLITPEVDHDRARQVHLLYQMEWATHPPSFVAGLF